MEQIDPESSPLPQDAEGRPTRPASGSRHIGASPVAPPSRTAGSPPPVPLPSSSYTGEPEEARLLVGKPARRWSPLSRVVIVAIVLSFVVAALWAFYNYREVPVLIARSDLPAYRAITSADVTLGTLRVRDASEYAGLPIDGRLTLTSVKGGSPLRVADLSPDVTTALPGGFVVVGLDVSRAGVLGGALSAGDPVQLLLAQQGVRIGELKAVVLSVSRDNTQAPNYSLVVAVSASDAQSFGPTLASGDGVVVIRDPHQR